MVTDPAPTVRTMSCSPTSSATVCGAALPDDLRGQVGTLDIEERYSMRLHLRDNRTVYWGADEDNANKARAMAAALQLEGTSFDVSNPELVGAR